MSAIAGVLHFDGGPTPAGSPADCVERLTHEMAPAGPEAQTRWSDGPIALGHCLLRTTVEAAAERQPLSSADGRFVLVWDGRLDNRPELRAALEAARLLVRDDTDAELVLQSFIAWGADCPKRLLGDFAFAIWDQLEASLFCARDPVGARPFFYVHTPQLFALASEDEPLVSLPGISNAIDEERVAHFLVPGFLGFDYGRSWLKEVRGLGAGQSLSVKRDGSAHASTYRRLEPLTEHRFDSDDECIEAFRDVFAQAVRSRLRASGDAALMLSGGLDSAAVLAAADTAAPDQALHTFSVVSDDEDGCIETRCIREMTRHRGSRSHFLSVPSFSGIADIGAVEQIAASRPHPIDHSLLLPATLCRSASANGHRVMLTGVCGDLTTHGTHDYIATLVARGQWRQAWNESRAAASRHTYLQGSSPLRIYLERLARRAAPAWAKTTVHSARSARANRLDGSLISPDFAQRVGVARWMRESRIGSLAQQPQQAHLAALAPPHGLASSLGGYNRVAARWGIEIRDPWADWRVLEFWLRLPLHYKFRTGWTKYLVRKTFARQLPGAVLHRVGKEHIGWNFLHRLMEDSRDRTRRTLEDGLGDVDNFIDAAAAHELYRRYLATGAHREREKLFDLLTLVAWLKHCQNIR